MTADTISNIRTFAWVPNVSLPWRMCTYRTSTYTRRRATRVLWLVASRAMASGVHLGYCSTAWTCGDELSSIDTDTGKLHIRHGDLDIQTATTRHASREQHSSLPPHLHSRYVAEELSHTRSLSSQVGQGRILFTVRQKSFTCRVYVMLYFKVTTW